MEILAYLKKQPKWCLRFNAAGEIETGMQYGSAKSHAIDIPIFRAKLKYAGHYQGTRSVMIKFKGCDEDSIIAILQGTGPCMYEMDRDDGMDIMENLILQDNPRLEYHGDGWFTGLFTFRKKGQRVFITPYTGDITKERAV